MKEFTGKVAVITGAASGIGRALADRCAQEGMKVVLADIETAALQQAETELKANGVETLAIVTDVSRAESVVALADQAYQTFGAVHLLFNNAGVGGGSSLWDTSLEDWQWILGVNLWGVIHGIHTFVPRMLAQNTEGCIVNTASIAGMVSSPGLGAYKVTKHAVVTLSETLSHELALHQSRLKVAVLCPGFVNTRILDSARNRPGGPPDSAGMSPADAAIRESVRQGIEAGLPPAQVADTVFAALREEKFYILTHAEYKEAIRLRMEDILHDRQPTNPQSSS